MYVVRRTFRTGLGDGSRLPGLLADWVEGISCAFLSAERFLLDALGVPPDRALLDPLALVVQRTIRTDSGDIFCSTALFRIASRDVGGVYFFL